MSEDPPTGTMWSSIWALYAENQDVFAAAFADLASAGVVIDQEAAADHVHEFLLDRAPSALATFRPERGELKPWLFVVFRRFVLGALREQSRREKLLRGLAASGGGDLSVERSRELPSDMDVAREAVKNLPPDQRRAI